MVGGWVWEWVRERNREKANEEMCQYWNRYLKLQTQKQIATYYKCNMSQTSIFISMQKYIYMHANILYVNVLE